VTNIRHIFALRKMGVLLDLMDSIDRILDSRFTYSNRVANDAELTKYTSLSREAPFCRVKTRL